MRPGNIWVVVQVKYLNNIVEQDQIEAMISKGQLLLQGCIKLSFADQFYAPAGKIRPV